jgi:hypothetical protein
MALHVLETIIEYHFGKIPEFPGGISPADIVTWYYSTTQIQCYDAAFRYKFSTCTNFRQLANFFSTSALRI